MADESEVVEARLPNTVGVLSSASGEEVRGGQVGRMTRREVRIYGAEVVRAAPAREPDDPKEVARLQVLAEENDVETGAKTISGLRAALEKAGVDVEE